MKTSGRDSLFKSTSNKIWEYASINSNNFKVMLLWGCVFDVLSSLISFSTSFLAVKVKESLMFFCLFTLYFLHTALQI